MSRLFSILVVVAASALTACATNIPKPISQAPPSNPTLAEVRANPQQFVGTQVRWGGVIAKVENLRDSTLVQIVARKLDGSGRPESGVYSGGRFIARYNGFIDPAVYAEGQPITVAGMIRGVETQPIGSYSYAFPVVDVTTTHLWEPLMSARYYDPFWYDHWYHPWYGYTYNPWWGPFGPWY